MFYDVFVELCAKSGKAPSAVALELGCSKSMVSGWKTRGTSPTDTNLRKIADYFGVTVEYLLGEQTEKAPAPKTERELLIDEVMKFVNTLSDEDLKGLYNLIVK